MSSAVSSVPQAEDDKVSLPQQETDARNLCLKEDWAIVDVLKTPGHSRYYLDLEECAADMMTQGIDTFDKLMMHVRARDFDVFICRDSERFARSQSLHARAQRGLPTSSGVPMSHKLVRDVKGEASHGDDRLSRITALDYHLSTMSVNFIPLNH